VCCAIQSFDWIRHEAQTKTETIDTTYKDYLSLSLSLTNVTVMYLYRMSLSLFMSNWTWNSHSRFLKRKISINSYLLFHPVPLLVTSAIMCYILSRLLLTADASPCCVHHLVCTKITQMMSYFVSNLLLLYKLLLHVCKSWWIII